jgi:hypothetical protein
MRFIAHHRLSRVPRSTRATLLAATIACGALLVLGARQARADASAYGSAVLSDRALAYWPLNDGSGAIARDEAGTAAGHLGPGASFSMDAPMAGGGSASGTIVVSHAVGHGLETPTWSVALWAKASQPPGVQGPWLFGAGQQYGWDLQMGPTGEAVIAADFSTTQGYPPVGSGQRSEFIGDGRWHFIVATFSGATLAVYVDGVLAGSEAVNGSTLYGCPDEYVIGGRYPGGFGDFLGHVSAVALFGYALSASQVSALYSAANAPPAPGGGGHHPAPGGRHPGVGLCQSPPSNVVILITGLTSELPFTESYDPLGQDYRGLAHQSETTGDLADLAVMSQHTFDNNNDGPITPVGLTDSLAATGTVLLPFSYDGVALTGPSTSPTYSVARFLPETPGAVDPKAEADGYLLGLIHQINRVWPAARIQVIGHSEGGFVAEQLFETEPLSALHNVTRIFSLDSPINGVAIASTGWVDTICRALATSHPNCLKIISPALLNLFSERWENKEPNDRRLIARDIAENQSYIPMGTQNDWLYKIADISTTFGLPTGVCEGLDTQVFWNDFSASCYLEDIQDELGRTPSNLSYTTPDPSTGTPARPGFAINSHSFVMQSADNVRFITHYGPGVIATSARTRTTELTPYETEVWPGRLAATGGLFDEPFRRGSSAQVSDPVTAAGRTLVIRGAGLGATPGRVYFNGVRGEVAAPVQVWSPNEIAAQVPPQARSGLVSVITPSEEQVIAGVVTVIEANNGVTHLTVSGRRRAVNGEGVTLRVRALRRAGPAAGVTVQLVSGLTSVRARTNRSGVARLSLIGYGHQTAILACGTTANALAIDWRRAPPEHLRITARKRRTVRGVTVFNVSVELTRRQRPVRGESIAVRLLALPGSALTSKRLKTNRGGLAYDTLRVPVERQTLVQATTGRGGVSQTLVVSS